MLWFAFLQFFDKLTLFWTALWLFCKLLEPHHNRKKMLRQCLTVADIAWYISYNGSKEFAKDTACFYCVQWCMSTFQIPESTFLHFCLLCRYISNAQHHSKHKIMKRLYIKYQLSAQCHNSVARLFVGGGYCHSRLLYIC